ncbi:MAG: AAA family ATPase [Planctomycetota bacterium]
MLTRLKVRNFKRFVNVDIELGKSVVFIGPNNSGKTTALQALALWDIGLRQWNAKRSGKASPKKRPGVTINRHDLVSIPVPAANLLWRGLHVRNMDKVKGKTQTRNIRVDISIDGITNGKSWSCGLEFDYSNEESFVCRPLRLPEYEEQPVGKAEFSEVPPEASEVKMAYLPPMSGLSDREFVKQQGEIDFLIGQGQTAQVLRNLCYKLSQNEDKSALDNIKQQISSLFGVKLLKPNYIPERSEIIMEYEEGRTRLDLSSAGRGLHQTLLLLAHLYANPGTVLLLDEPDAHLEILRQREIYGLLTDVTEQQNSQIIAASHSEVVLNEAADRGKVIAFVGKPHVMNPQSRQVLKSLKSIGWDQYYQAEETGWVLYVEGATDLNILRAFAKILDHSAAKYLNRPFVHYVGNLPNKAREHFFGVREAKPDLQGIAIFDRLDQSLHSDSELIELMWNRREIENYFCTEEVLLAYAQQHQPGGLFSQSKVDAMHESISEVAKLLEIDELAPWSSDIKATDQVFDRVFRLFFKKLDLSITFGKSDYHELASLLSKDKIDAEIMEKLDAIAEVAKKATPRTE